MAEAPLTPHRFAALAEAYGGDLRRWPESVRHDARRLAAQDESAAAILARNAELDVQLDGFRIAGPGAALTQAIIASAPIPHRIRIGRWWTGLALAGAALAGAFSGAAAIAIAPPPAVDRAASAPAEATALFEDPQDDGS